VQNVEGSALFKVSPFEESHIISAKFIHLSANLCLTTVNKLIKWNTAVLIETVR
jgi:hypothetical protein